MEREFSDKIKDEFLQEIEYLKTVYEERNNIKLFFDITNFNIQEKVKDDII